MKFSSFVGSAVIYAAGIGTGLYMCYKGLKLAAEIICEEPKANNVKRERVIVVESRDYDTECGNAFFATRSDAEEAVTKLQNIIDAYGYATTSDLHHLAYIKDFEGDDIRGWKDLSMAEVMRTKDGYRLRLGKPVVIDTYKVYKEGLHGQ